MTQPQQEQQIPDAAEAARVFASVARRSAKLMSGYLKRHPDRKGAAFTDEFGIAKAFMELSAKMLANETPTSLIAPCGRL